MVKEEAEEEEEEKEDEEEEEEHRVFSVAAAREPCPIPACVPLLSWTSPTWPPQKWDRVQRVEAHRCRTMSRCKVTRVCGAIFPLRWPQRTFPLSNCARTVLEEEQSACQ